MFSARADNRGQCLGDNNLMSRLMPLFPLRMVAFPGSSIPLHIFEDRYKEMVGEAITADSEFGILLGESGGVVDVGCAMKVETVLERYPDGRFDIIARGQSRFTVLSINEDKAYLQGEVELFDDLDWSVVPNDLRADALEAWLRIDGASEGGRDAKSDPPDPTAVRLSFEIAQRVDDLDFQNTMLRMRSETERLEQFLKFVDGHVEKLAYEAKMKRVVPMNGSGHKPKGV